jgi:hypothetical protein
VLSALVADGAEQQLAKAAETAGADDEEVGARGLAREHAHRLAFDDDRLDLDVAAAFAELRNRGVHRLRQRDAKILAEPRRRRGSDRGPDERRRRVPGADDAQRRAARPCLLERDVERGAPPRSASDDYGR